MKRSSMCGESNVFPELVSVMSMINTLKTLEVGIFLSFFL